MRLIDADALAGKMREGQQTSKMKVWSLLINYAPTVDIVMCKDCDLKGDDGFCFIVEDYPDDDQFCSWGERRTE